MQASPSADMKKTLQDLSTSSFPFTRRAAAQQLGQLSFSNDEIVQALAAAVTLDGDADVRSAALQALQSPVHQAFLKDHPDFIREATKSAAQNRAQAKQQDEYKIIAEFLRRRTRERIYYLILFGGMVSSCVMIMVALSLDWLRQWTVCAWQVGFIAFTILIFYLSWRNWRCPACESWLGGYRFQVNALWSSDTLRCPQCGTRLL